MRHFNDNQRGFALVYGLVVLLLASVGGTALLFLAKKDHTIASDYSQMRSASLAAMAALKSFEGRLRSAPDSSLKLLKTYMNAPGKKYISGNALSSSEVKVKLWGNNLVNGMQSPGFSTKIISFDKTSRFITIEGKGYGSNGGIKKVIATYHLGGLGISDVPIGTGSGLHLGGRLQNCNARISIKGDVYLSMAGGSPQHFNKGGQIYGNLKTAASSNTMDLTDSLTVTGNAFMQCRMEPQAQFFIKGDGGFTNSFSSNFTKAIRINGHAYFIQSISSGFEHCIDGDKDGGKTAYRISGIPSNYFKDFSFYQVIPTASATASYVASHLGMTTGSESSFGLNLPSWGSGVVQDVASGSTVKGQDVEDWWNSHKGSGTLFKGEWLVLQLKGDISMNGGTFSRKAIWITGNRNISVNQKWYHCTDASNTLIIVNGSGCLQNMGVSNDNVFRGMIYVTSTNSNMSYKFGKRTIFYGMLHHVGSASFNLNDGTPPTDSVRIWYTEPLGTSAVQEIINTGIMLAPGSTVPPLQELILVDIKIRPVMAQLQL